QELALSFSKIKQYLATNQIQEFRDSFLDLHLYEQGEFYQSLTQEERVHLYSYLSPKEVADAFDLIEEDKETMTDYLSEMRPSYAAAMLSAMYTDNAVDFLNLLGKKETAKYLSLMSNEEAAEIKELLHYED